MVSITNMKIAGMNNPIGLDEQGPVITWEFASDHAERNLRQKSRNLSVRDQETGSLVFASDKMMDETQQVELSDVKLEPCKVYTITLKAELNNGKTLTEETFFETGFLGQKAWEAKWIGPDREKRQNMTYEDFANAAGITVGEPIADGTRDLYPVVRFDRPLVLKKAVKKARIYASARGVYELEIDGIKVGDMELAPEFSNYDQILQYQTYDVTAMLQQKDDIMLSVFLADGYYTGRIGGMGLGYDYGDYNSFLLQMEITYEDGSIEQILSDETWKYAETHIRYSDLFIGEKQDLRMEKQEAEKPACVFEEKYDILTGQAAEPLKVIRKLQAVSVMMTPKGETVIDFGQVLAGRTCIELDGKAGQTVIIDHQETLDENGNFFFNVYGFNGEQQDIYILREGSQILSPRFSTHGFRYARVSGYEGKITPEQCKALVISSDLERTGEYHFSDSRIEQLEHNIFWSQIGNFYSIPTDCPSRERAGWTGDVQIYAETACAHQDIRAFMKRWLREMKTEQRTNGEIPVVVPYTSCYRMIQTMSFQSDTSSGWGDACTIVPWKLYEAYGDITILEENFEMMEKWMAYISQKAMEIPEGDWTEEQREYQKYLWNTGVHYGDWLYPSAVNEKGESDAFLSAVMTATKAAPAMYAYSAQTMIKVCEALGKIKRAEEYRGLNENIKKAYSAIYVEEDGKIEPELQGIYILALAMDLIPAHLKEKTFGHLLRLIHENGDRLDAGFLSIPFLLDVVYSSPEPELAYRLLYSEELPGWLYEVKNGATTMWEQWDCIRKDGRPASGASFNHYAFGCVGSFLYRTIIGLKPLEPGWHKFQVRPDFNCELDSAGASYRSVYGNIQVMWKKDDEEVSVDIHVPVNTQAVVELSYKGETVRETVGSGKYHYCIKAAKY